MKIRYALPLAAILSVILLSGAKCALVVTSGGNSDKDKENNDGTLVVVTNTGQFIDAPVAGLRYTAGVVSGVTGRQGEFDYLPGQPVRFYIGAVFLGEAARGKAVLTPLDLVENGTLDTPAVINIARLLQSLDAVPGDAAITLPEAAAATGASRATRAPVAVDFHDPDAFANTASQLVATLTAGYPFTAVLVTPEHARRHLATSLDRAGIPHE